MISIMVFGACLHKNIICKLINSGESNELLTVITMESSSYTN